MQQPYFIVVLAHSLHGRLRRIHVPYTFVYAVLALALLGTFSLFGFVSSYARMVWKVANYNHLRGEIDALRTRYQSLQRESSQTREQLATLQLFASEVSIAYGIKKKLEGPASIAQEGRLMPTFHETLDTYQFLRTANFSAPMPTFARQWHTNVVPSLWPLNGRLLSPFGMREDPFSGGDRFHAGCDISAPIGTPVLTTADGMVRFANWNGSYGKLVVVDHGGGIETYYAHLSRILVLPGQEVRRGQVVALSGGTGRVTSPHLHYEVRRAGIPVNPYRFLAQTAVAQPVRRDLPF